MSDINQIMNTIPVEDQQRWMREILYIKPLKSFVINEILGDLVGFDLRYKDQFDLGIRNKTDYLIAEFIRSDYFRQSPEDLVKSDYLITKLEIYLQ
tara:strand:- start:304 stop:591 length:288 start_codon:yes stop_codon:yes gene_type:complete